jgi:transcriptional regulator with XRE-family HTH domain
MGILDRIRLVRKTLNLNQVEFAKRIGLTQTALSMIEVGETALTEKNIKLICTTFAVDENWLRTENGEMFSTASPYEKELLTVFSKLKPDTQEFILEMAQNLLKRQEKQNDYDYKEDVKKKRNSY